MSGVTPVEAAGDSLRAMCAFLHMDQNQKFTEADRESVRHDVGRLAQCVDQMDAGFVALGGVYDTVSVGVVRGVVLVEPVFVLRLMTLVGDVRHRVRLTVDDAVLGRHQVRWRRRRQLLQAECLVVDTLADRVVVVGHVAAVTRAMQLSARDVEVKRREARAVLVGAHGTCGVEPRMSLVAL